MLLFIGSGESECELRGAMGTPSELNLDFPDGRMTSEHIFELAQCHRIRSPFHPKMEADVGFLIPNGLPDQQQALDDARLARRVRAEEQGYRSQTNKSGGFPDLEISQCQV
jgi:hypothetical protein